MGDDDEGGNGARKALPTTKGACCRSFCCPLRAACRQGEGVAIWSLVAMVVAHGSDSDAVDIRQAKTVLNGDGQDRLLCWLASPRLNSLLSLTFLFLVLVPVPYLYLAHGRAVPHSR